MNFDFDTSTPLYLGTPFGGGSKLGWPVAATVC